MNEEIIISPCVSVCKTDPVTGYCYGCGRKDAEKVIWKDPKTSNDWKKTNLISLKERLQGWQLKAFEKSYAFKKENGISLIKHKILLQKK